MKIILLKVLFATFVLFSCNQQVNKIEKKTDFEKKEELISQKLKSNKRTYIIRKGEKIKIYYTNNSCCLFCSPRLDKLKHSKFINKKAETTSDNCEGCTDLYSLNFICLNQGIDTVFMTTLTPHKNCETYSEFKQKEKHIIIVK